MTTLLGYLAAVSELAATPRSPEFCRSWERRLRRQVGSVRKAAIELGLDPDAAVPAARPHPPPDAPRTGSPGRWVRWASGPTARSPGESSPSGACSSQVRGCPSSGVDASACSFRGIRPARRAPYPASTARRMASAIRSGSFARATELDRRTPTPPELHRLRRVGGGAYPRVEDHRDRRPLDDDLQVVRITDPHAGADRRPSGMTAAQPASSRRRARLGSSLV